MMKPLITSVTVVGLLMIAGCGEDSMSENDTDHAVKSETLSSVRIHIEGFKKSKSGAT